MNSLRKNYKKILGITWATVILFLAALTYNYLHAHGMSFREGLLMAQADIKGTAILEITTVFGGTKLIVPSNWEVKSEAVTIFGGLEDKRNMQTIINNSDKILVLKGTVLFGGIEIKSF